MVDKADETEMVVEALVGAWHRAATLRVSANGRTQADDLCDETALLTELVNSLERFLRSASHDLRTALTTMKVSVAVLRRSPDLEKRLRHLALLDVQATRLHRLLDEMQSVVCGHRVGKNGRMSSVEPGAALGACLGYGEAPDAGEREDGHMTMSAVYEFRVRGYLDPERTEWFDGLAIAHEPNGCTTLTGPVQDQAVLHGVLVKIRDLNLELVSVNALEQVSGALRSGADF